MNKFINRILCAAVALAVSTGAHAICAYPGTISVSQPDGSVVTVRIHGDENRNWITTPDGYTLVHDANGILAYATEKAGKVIPSRLRYRNGNSAEAAAMGIKPGLRTGSGTINGGRLKTSQKGFQTQIDATFPSKGKRKLLMLLVNYSNTTPTFTQQDFDGYMNVENYNGIGSFRDYYIENSYGQLEVNTTVTEWVTVPNEKSYYGADGAVALIADALRMIDDKIDFSEYDNDGDGIVDGLAVIHQGPGREATGSNDDIWSHSSTIYGMEFDGVQIRSYTIQPELLGNVGTRMSTIGVMCHEFGHNLGAPDFYDTDYELSGGEYPGTGIWDLMGSGAWNGDRGDRPAATNMWQKIQLGWVEPTVLTENTSVPDIKGATYSPEAYRFDCTVPGEYFIIENRQREGNFDSALPGEGLLIYHIDESLVDKALVPNTVNAAYPQGAYTVCAGSMHEPEADAYTYGNVNSDICPFPGSMGVTSFNDRTKPSTRSRTGRYTYKGLQNIKQNDDGTMRFDFVCEKEPARPQNLSAVSNRGVTTLSWDAPEGEEAPLRYNVSRNGEIIATVSECSYTDNTVGDLSDLTYTVDAEYAGGLVSPYVSVSIRIPVNCIKSVTATVHDGNDVGIDLELNTTLTRMQGDNENFEMTDISAKSLDYAHRFRAEDLTVYQGYKIRKIAFYPCQSQRELKCFLRVWESEPGASQPGKLISERELKEFGNTVWNNITLTKSVEITGDKDLWIGVHCESSTNNVTILTDKGPAVDGYGNMVSIEGAPWGTDLRINGNVFCFATLQKPAALADCQVRVPEGEADTQLDMYYPYAFGIYRDGELLATTATTSFTDKEVPEGHHVYSVSGLFKGGNESHGIDAEIEIGTSGIGAALTTVPAISVNGETLTINGYGGNLLITAIDGTAVFSGKYVSGTAVNLHRGFYILTTDFGTAKVVIR